MVQSHHPAGARPHPIGEACHTAGACRLPQPSRCHPATAWHRACPRPPLTQLLRSYASGAPCCTVRRARRAFARPRHAPRPSDRTAAARHHPVAHRAHPSGSVRLAAGSPNRLPVQPRHAVVTPRHAVVAPCHAVVAPCLPVTLPCHAADGRRLPNRAPHHAAVFPPCVRRARRGAIVPDRLPNEAWGLAVVAWRHPSRLSRHPSVRVRVAAGGRIFARLSSACAARPPNLATRANRTSPFTYPLTQRTPVFARGRPNSPKTWLNAAFQRD